MLKTRIQRASASSSFAILAAGLLVLAEGCGGAAVAQTSADGSTGSVDPSSDAAVGDAPKPMDTDPPADEDAHAPHVDASSTTDASAGIDASAGACVSDPSGDSACSAIPLQTPLPNFYRCAPSEMPPGCTDVGQEFGGDGGSLSKTFWCCP